MKEATLTLKNRLGLHARAAAKLVHAASSFDAKVSLTRDGEEVDGKSILGLLLLAAGKGTPLLVRVEGSDEEQALAALRDLVDRKFDEADWKGAGEPRRFPRIATMDGEASTFADRNPRVPRRRRRAGRALGLARGFLAEADARAGGDRARDRAVPPGGRGRGPTRSSPRPGT